MHSQQLLQMSELPDGEVRRPRRLHALVTHDADANVGCQDHRYVVAAIPDSQRDFLEPAVHQVHHLRLLRRSTSSADDDCAGLAQGNQLLLRSRLRQRKGCSSNHQRLALRPRRLLLRLAQLLLQLPPVGRVDDGERHVGGDDGGGEGDGERRLELVPGQDPHMHACPDQILNCLRNLLLQFVFHRRHAMADKIPLQRLIQPRDLLLAAIEHCAGPVESGFERDELVF
mmetsp:Transcript_25981/g.58709  ORF Transcript_25981/g.58709 Transcript_25981/m.58709 type:complete len:228 (+) Transcript_25981:981-1664(+)